MGQGFKVAGSSELSCKWPKVAETMTVALFRYCQSFGLISPVSWTRSLLSRNQLKAEPQPISNHYPSAMVFPSVPGLIGRLEEQVQRLGAEAS
jgi:hypothetical protein